MASQFRLAVIQMSVGANKGRNLERAAELVSRAAKEFKVQLVALPECFNSPYGTKHFPEYAEPVPADKSQWGDSTRALSAMAADNKVFLVGGSIPERDGDKLYNTCTAWSPEGRMVAKYRKMHLFDIDVPGKITFKESEVLSPGNSLAVLDTPFGCRVGLGICYDIRFAELAQVYARQHDCHLLLYPGAFNMTTGG